jgi:hypothetical protein
VHTGTNADALSRSLQARAFTTGQDIFFRSGEYSPASSSGQKLIAHELTHTKQQMGSARIARWGSPPGKKATEHKEVTEEAFKGLPNRYKKWYPKDAQAIVGAWSDALDHRVKTFGTVLWGQMKQGWAEKKKKGMYGMNPAEWDDLVGYSRDSKEAINHAEGGMYKGDGSAAHVGRWEGYVSDAVKALGTNDLEDAFQSLGYALHTAEDRGSHGDGRPGEGHDPRRYVQPPEGARNKKFYKPGWESVDCDRKWKNPGGYKLAVKEAQKALKGFIKGALGLKGGLKTLFKRIYFFFGGTTSTDLVTLGSLLGFTDSKTKKLKRFGRKVKGFFGTGARY